MLVHCEWCCFVVVDRIEGSCAVGLKMVGELFVWWGADAVIHDIKYLSIPGVTPANDDSIRLLRLHFM